MSNNQALSVTPINPGVLTANQGRMNSALVHEIRNPLASIDLAAHMLDSFMADDQAKEYLDIIRRGAARINFLVENLFKPRIKERNVRQHSILELLNAVLVTVKDRVFLKHIQVKKNYSHDWTVLVSGEEMKIALTNIIVNSIDAMSPNGELSISTCQSGGQFIVVIKDNGCGMSQTNLKKMFTPFFTNKIDGMGIGLVASRYIFHLNNVLVKVRSQENIGTSFFLFFHGNVTSRLTLSSVHNFRVMKSPTPAPLASPVYSS